MYTLIIGDVHLSDKPPASCTDSYNDDLFDLLEQCVDVARDHDVGRVIFTGDIFHNKAPSRTSHATVQRFIGICQKMTRSSGGRDICVVQIVTGNHDIQFDRLDTLPRQPLGTVMRTVARPFDGRGLFIGIPFARDAQAQLEAYAPAVQASQHPLVVAHLPILPDGKSVPYADECIRMSEAMKILGKCDLYYGHIHDDDGHFFNEEEGFAAGSVANFGAITRGSLTESNWSRQVKVAIHDLNAGPGARFRPIFLDAKPPEIIYRMQTIVAAAEAKTSVDGFLDAIRETQLDKISPERVLAYLTGEGVDPDVLDVIKELLETV